MINIMKTISNYPISWKIPKKDIKFSHHLQNKKSIPVKMSLRNRINNHQYISLKLSLTCQTHNIKSSKTIKKVKNFKSKNNSANLPELNLKNEKNTMF